MKYIFILLSILYTGSLLAQKQSVPTLPYSMNYPKDKLYASGKPYTRWWWFAQEIGKEDLKAQLDWAKEQHFGGVEVAWMYPLYRYNNFKWFGQLYDTVQTAAAWLSPEWQDLVIYTKKYADSIGLGCDFTFGTSWPMGDTKVAWQDRTQIWGDTNFHQKLTFSWEYPKIGTVVSHLDKAAFLRYAERTAKGLQPAIVGKPNSMLSESWEIKLNATNKLWTKGFDSAFVKKFGYDIVPFMPKLDSFPEVRYDYMKLLSEYVINHYYRPFHETCRKYGSFSRAECLDSPTDIMTTYGEVDFPESETMLNEPNYAKIVSSAAALAGKKVITCESFTCLYGFPHKFHKEEQTADLKMIADASFANGVNQVFWVGMPYNPANTDTINFFATAHVGKKGNLTAELPAFNDYMEKVSRVMQQGKTYSNTAVYIPFEDAVMAGAYPQHLQRKWVWGQYEMRYIHTPDALKGYQPLWINGEYLKRGKIEKGKLKVADLSFEILYIDVEYMDIESVKTIANLAKQGLPICLKRIPKEPSHLKSANYAKYWLQIQSYKNVSTQLPQKIQPLLSSKDSLPDFWCREIKGDYYIFFAQPQAQRLHFPLTSGQSYTQDTVIQNINIHLWGKNYPVQLCFLPYQSLLLKIDKKGKMTFLDIYFLPKIPIVKPNTFEKTYF